jgi:hypothetical protein
MNPTDLTTTPTTTDAPELSPAKKRWHARRRAAGTTESRALKPYVAKKRLGRIVDENFDKLILKRMALFKCDALDALEDLATMPINEDSALMKVKYLAACWLTGKPAEDGPPQEHGGLEATLRRLDEDYHKQAPRIKSIRERIVTFEESPIAIDSSSSVLLEP